MRQLLPPLLNYWLRQLPPHFELLVQLLPPVPMLPPLLAWLLCLAAAADLRKHAAWQGQHP